MDNSSQFSLFSQTLDSIHFSQHPIDQTIENENVSITEKKNSMELLDNVLKMKPFWYEESVVEKNKLDWEHSSDSQMIFNKNIIEEDEAIKKAEELRMAHTKHLEELEKKNILNQMTIQYMQRDLIRLLEENQALGKTILMVRDAVLAEYRLKMKGSFNKIWKPKKVNRKN